MPVVLISSQSEFENFDIVMVDNIEGAKLAVNHLIELGHRKIGIVGGARDVSSSQKRYEGFIEALKTARIKLNKNFITEDSLDNEGGYRCAKKLLAQKEKPTALFATNDTMAIGALSAIHEAGFRIPDDISLIGFDDLSFSKMTYPKLTTIRQPKFKTGEVATEQLFKHLLSPSKSLPPKKIILDHELIVRETTGPILNSRS
jgi:DNA-binding LacI/PurR family transcriptional regulator